MVRASQPRRCRCTGCPAFEGPLDQAVFLPRAMERIPRALEPLSWEVLNRRALGSKGCASTPRRRSAARTALPESSECRVRGIPAQQHGDLAEIGGHVRAAVAVCVTSRLMRVLRRCALRGADARRRRPPRCAARARSPLRCRRGRRAMIDDEVGVLLGTDASPMRKPLEAAAFDQRAA